MNEKTKGSNGVEHGFGSKQKVEISRKEKENNRQTKCVKALCLDGITAEIKKYVGETVVKWIFIICDFAWRQRGIPDEL